MSDTGDSRSGWARREFLNTTGTIIVGIGFIDWPMVGGRSEARQAYGQHPGSPDEAELDSWITINPDNTATIFSGHIDHGGGGPTVLRQIAAEELDLDFSQVATVRMSTGTSIVGNTGASMTAAMGGVRLRAAVAEARRVLLTRASERLKAPVGSLSVAKGVVSVGNDPNRSITYAALLGDQSFDTRFEPVTYREVGIEVPRSNGDHAPQKPPSQYKIVGTRVPRFDTPDKVSGKHVYMQHVRVPGMVHARIVWPRGQGSYGAGLKVISIDEKSVADIPGVQIVRRGDFVGVVAEREWDAVRAARQLKVTWQALPATLPGNAGLHDKFRNSKTEDLVIVNTGDQGAASQATHVLSATYRGPYQAHAVMAPNCAIADVKKDSAVVMCSDQAAYTCRQVVAKVLDFPVEKVNVQYYEGSCTFGPSCYKDAAQAAAIMSQELGKPVRLQFMRWDEFGWENYALAHLADVRLAADNTGKLVAFDYQGWNHGYTYLQTTEQMAGAAPFINDQRGNTAQLRLSQSDMYDVPNRRMIDHRVPGLEGYLRTGPVRAPQDPPYFFAQEQALDELAHLCRIDAYEIRRKNISDERWLGVLKAATEASKWTPRVAASTVSSDRIATGRGLALGTHHVPRNQGDRLTYAAAVVTIEVNKETGLIVAKHVYGAMDCGLAINPSNVENQIIGMAIHGTSVALKEEVKFNTTNVTSLDWSTYSILRFREHPAVTPIVVQRINEKSSGAGEELLPAVLAAIANAFFDATGVRIREFPLTPERVLAALKGATGKPA
jgi:nicotinate dehydrogenase subunit B